MADDDRPIDPDAPLTARLHDRWRVHLDDAQRSAVIAWASFATTFRGPCPDPLGISEH